MAMRSATKSSLIMSSSLGIEHYVSHTSFPIFLLLRFLMLVLALGSLIARSWASRGAGQNRRLQQMLPDHASHHLICRCYHSLSCRACLAPVVAALRCRASSRVPWSGASWPALPPSANTYVSCSRCAPAPRTARVRRRLLPWCVWEYTPADTSAKKVCGVPLRQSS